jgi:hypothetical protein
MKYTISILLTVLIFSFKATAQEAMQQHCNSIKQLEWLTGTWTTKGGSNQQIEHWQKVSENTLEGLNFVHPKDINSEYMLFTIMAEHLYFITKVSHNSHPIAFKLTSCHLPSTPTKLTSAYWVFENKTHDFPTQITYTMISSQHLDVSISGPSKKTITFSFTKNN